MTSQLDRSKLPIRKQPFAGVANKTLYLPDAMADKTIEWLNPIRAQDAGKRFFTYFSTGCSHAPHHVSAEWAAKYQGWDKLREETFARQKALGVIPADPELTSRDDALPFTIR